VFEHVRFRVSPLEKLVVLSVEKLRANVIIISYPKYTAKSVDMVKENIYLPNKIHFKRQLLM